MYTISSIAFFKKKKIKRKQFRKKINLLDKVFKLKPIFSKKRIYKNLNFYKKYQTTTIKQNIKAITPIHKTPIIISISQKKFNPKCTIHENKNMNTFSVGSIIKYFKVKQSKYIRRSIKGLKIFLNFLKNILEKFYLKENKKYTIFNLSGIDYNLVNLKKNIKTLIKNNNTPKLLFLVNLRVSFTKKKEKKVKAIKKRLKKKIISNFIKNTV
jgi:hypothetical protein